MNDKHFYISCMAEIAQKNERLKKFNSNRPKYAIMNEHTCEKLHAGNPMARCFPENEERTVFGLRILFDNKLKTGEIEVR